MRAIRDLIPQIARTAPGEQGSKVRLLEGEEEEDFVTESEVVPEEVQGAVCEEEELQDEKILEFQRDVASWIWQYADNRWQDGKQQLHRQRENKERSTEKTDRRNIRIKKKLQPYGCSFPHVHY